MFHFTHILREMLILEPLTLNLFFISLSGRDGAAAPPRRSVNGPHREAPAEAADPVAAFFDGQLLLPKEGGYASGSRNPAQTAESFHWFG